MTSTGSRGSILSPWRSRVGSSANGDGKHPSGDGTSSAALLPTALVGVFFKALFGVTVGLYILNQKHMLPKPLSRIVSKALFWPTMPITVVKRLGSWTTPIDDTVIMGGIPFGFVGFPEHLYEEGVRGVINFCEEYNGPVASYQRLGMTQLHLPTVDHFEPRVQDYQEAVKFIRQHHAKGSKVYIHCRAGHGRSAAGAFAWLLAQDPSADPQSVNQYMCLKRNVRKTLWKQPNLRRFHTNLKEEEFATVEKSVDHEPNGGSKEHDE